MRAVDVTSRSITIEGPLDLRATLRPLHGWFADDGWWLTARTPLGPGSLRIRRTRDELIGDAWGDGGPWLLDRLGGIAGLADDPTEFETDHPLIGELHRRHPGWRFGRTDLVFDALVRAICGQKVTGEQATAALRGLRRQFGDPAPGPRELRLPPDPEPMARAPYWVYHGLHLEKRRADLLRRVAATAARIDKSRDSPPQKPRPSWSRSRGWDCGRCRRRFRSPTATPTRSTSVTFTSSTSWSITSRADRVGQMRRCSAARAIPPSSGTGDPAPPHPGP